jgi:hypothetical protein
VYESAEVLASLDLVGRIRANEVLRTLGRGWSQAQPAMWPVAVVLDVDAQDMLELFAARDQEPVEVLAADGADPALGEHVRVWCPKRGADDLDAFALEDVIEGAAELTVAVVDQKPDRPRALRA